MKFQLDENLPKDLSDFLRRKGHTANSIREDGLCGTSDLEIGQICQREQRILLTLDFDFADILRFPPAEHFGIIVFSLPTPTFNTISALLEDALRYLENQPIKGCLWIVESGKVRIRHG